MDTRFHVPPWLQPLDRHLTAWMDRHGILLLRVAVGVVFVWFGVLKLFPGASPATGLIVSTYPFLPERLFVAFVGCWEVVIGLGFVTGRLLRVTVALMYLQMLGAMSPVALNPAAVFVRAHARGAVHHQAGSARGRYRGRRTGASLTAVRAHARGAVHRQESGSARGRYRGRRTGASLARRSRPLQRSRPAAGVAVRFARGAAAARCR